MGAVVFALQLTAFHITSKELVHTGFSSYLGTVSLP